MNSFITFCIGLVVGAFIGIAWLHYIEYRLALDKEEEREFYKNKKDRRRKNENKE